jgi:hypothetical protein
LVKTFALIFCALGLSSSFVMGRDDFEILKAEAIFQFVKQANTAGSELAKIIEWYNKETADGRNPNGTVTLPVTRADLQAFVLSGEIQYQPFHYGEHKDGRCVATGNSATVLIALSTRELVHLAREFGILTFTTSVEEHLSFAAKTNGSQSCEEESEDAKVKRVLQTSNFKQIKLDITAEEEK